ncbi:hypothetical protein Lal_00007085 [Lupinus albus]|nr:hypothetical protein Lal_00007085 [Lupinus albus]
MSADAFTARCFVPYPFVPQPQAATGPLAGVRLAVKDIFDVAGYPTGCGNAHMLALSGIKTTSAPAVQSLLQAGAQFVGKVVTDELAFSMNGKNAHFGTPRNGGAPERIPGGSSSGSASAVSNGLADLALGTDTGGSVRVPASHCGLIGLRPTHGRVPLAGVMDLASSFDTCGWFARDMEVFTRAGAVLLGEDSAPLPQAPRVLVASDVLGLLAPRVQAQFAQVLERLAGVLGAPQPVTAATPSFDALYWAFRHIQGYEAWQAHGENISPGAGRGRTLCLVGHHHGAADAGTQRRARDLPRRLHRPAGRRRRAALAQRAGCGTAADRFGTVAGRLSQPGGAHALPVRAVGMSADLAALDATRWRAVRTVLDRTAWQ